MNGEMTFLADEANTCLFLDHEAFLSFDRGYDLESWQATIAFLFWDHDSITSVNGAFTGIRENEAARLSAIFSLNPNRTCHLERRIADRRGYDIGAIHASVPHVSHWR